MYEGIRHDKKRQVILFEMLIILALASMYYNLAFQKKTDMLYIDCSLIHYRNITRTGTATCTRAFTKAFETNYDTSLVAFSNLSLAYPVRETVTILTGQPDTCAFRVCADNDPVCLSVRLLNVTISSDKRTECEKLNDVCFNHGSVKCHRLTGTERGCECTD